MDDDGRPTADDDGRRRKTMDDDGRPTAEDHGRRRTTSTVERRRSKTDGPQCERARRATIACVDDGDGTVDVFLAPVVCGGAARPAAAAQASMCGFRSGWEPPTSTVVIACCPSCVLARPRPSSVILSGQEGEGRLTHLEPEDLVITGLRMLPSSSGATARHQ